MRITPKRLLQSGLLIIVIVCLLYYANHRRLQSGNAQTEECSHRRPDDQTRLVYLSERVHRALNILQVTHFLCHDSLWASLYQEGPRSWDRTLDLCLIGEDLTGQDEGFVARFFKTQDLILEYDMMEGLYTVRLQPKIKFPGIPSAGELPDVLARLILFQSRSNSMMVMRKSGVKRALLPDDCDNTLLECFPIHLVQKPLSSIKFGNNELPAPKEGIEIQKYHYPDDWWLQRKIPPVC